MLASIGILVAAEHTAPKCALLVLEPSQAHGARWASVILAWYITMYSLVSVGVIGHNQ